MFDIAVLSSLLFLSLEFHATLVIAVRESVEDVYVGDGILKQIPPLPYIGGVIQYQVNHTYTNSYTIAKNYRGWKTVFWVEKIDISLKDTVKLTGARGRLIFFNKTSAGRTYVVNGERMSIIVASNGIRQRDLRIRWMTSPSVEDINAGFFNEGEAKINSSYSVQSLLLNLIDDAGDKWYVKAPGHDPIDLKRGIQVVNFNATQLRLIDVISLNRTRINYLIEWFAWVPHEQIVTFTRPFTGCISSSSQGAVIQRQEWTIKESGFNLQAPSIELMFVDVRLQNDEYELTVNINNQDILTSTMSISKFSAYVIPVSLESNMTLTLDGHGPYELHICYKTSAQDKFGAGGIIEASSYSYGMYHSTPMTMWYSFPLPKNWHITFKAKSDGLNPYRDWVDLVIAGTRRERDQLMRSLTGWTGLVRYYPRTMTFSQEWLRNRTYGRMYREPKQVIAVFSTVPLPIRHRNNTFEMSWTAREEKVDDVVNKTLFYVDSGNISSKNYPNYYYCDQIEFYDIQIVSPQLKMIQIKFGPTQINIDDSFMIYDKPYGGSAVKGISSHHNLTGQSFCVNATKIRIVLKANSGGSGMGFNLAWQAVQNCTPWETRKALSRKLHDVTPSIIDSSVRVEKNDRTDSGSCKSLYLYVTSGLATLVLAQAIFQCVLVKKVFHYRRLLSDVVNEEGYHKPKYTHAHTNRQVNASAISVTSPVATGT